MKKNILKLLSLAAVAVLGWSCETDYFNEHNLDGWESDTEITDVQTIEYTLEAADYATIANNATNKATAEAAGAEAIAALEAVKTNCYFTSATDAETYLKAFVVSKYNNYFSNGSSVSVNYNLAEPQSQEMLDLNAAKEYTLKNDDYKTIWGSDTKFESYVTPATMDKLAGAISSEGLEAGDYVVVTYNYSEEEPKAKEPEEPSTPSDPDEPSTPTYEYTSVLGTAVLNDAVTVTGYISAVSSQGPILTDKGGSVLLYKTTGYEIGDVLTVSGTISSYNKGFQIGTTNLTIEKLGTTEVTYPSTAMELTGAKMDELLTSRTADEYAHYAKMTGTVAVSGNYYNFNVEGATTAVGSIYGATDELKAKLSDGMQCTLYGYFISISKTSGAPKYINLIVTDVVEASAASLNAAMAAQTEKRYGYFQWNGSAFSAVNLDVVQPTDYEAMNNKYGSITYPEQEFYIPKFLNLQYPYAKEGDTARVAYRSYNSGSTAWVVEEYLYDGSNWARDLHLETGSAPYKKIDGNWTFDPSMTIVLNPDKSEYSKLYYMTAFEWVYNNKHEGYTLDNRTGNRTTDAEYYSGCAAGFTNLNWRINTLPKYYWGQAGEDITPYDNWSSEDPTVAKPVFELFYSECEKRFGEVMAATLGILHPNQRLISGMDVIYTVQIMVYANASNLGSSNNRVTHAFEFKVVGDGQFEYVRMYALDPKFDLYYDFN